MINYWLDKRSKRNSKKECWGRIESLAQRGLGFHNKQFNKSCLCNFELLHQGVTAIPSCNIKYHINSDGEVEIRYLDADNFPIEGYEWIAKECNWCKLNGSIAPCAEGFFHIHNRNGSHQHVAMSLCLKEIQFKDYGDFGRTELVLTFLPVF